MRERRNIDKIFRENFHNVETPVPNDVWDNIDAVLPKGKKKKRIVPVWFKIAGAAAVLLIIGSLYFNQSIDNISTHTQWVNNSHDSISKRINPVSSQFNMIMESASKSLNSAISNTKESIIDKTNLAEQSHYKREKFSTNFERRAKLRVSQNDPHFQKSVLISNTNTEIKQVTTDKEIIEIVNTQINSLEDSDVVAINTEKDKDINEVKDTEEVGDLNALAKIEKDKKEEDLEENESSKRFSIASSAAAIAFNNIGTGNSLAISNLSNNAISNDIATSYGIKIAYQLTEKLKLRSGMNKVNFSSHISDISYNSISASILNNNPIPDHSNNNIITHLQPRFGILEGNTITGPNRPEIHTIDNNKDYNVVENARNYDNIASLHQNVEYLEVPLEMEYSIINKKLDVTLIGGLSTLFLGNTENKLKADQQELRLENVSKLNKLSFTSNIGIGMDYGLSKNLDIFLEPTLKYQFNSSWDNPDYSPYFIGVYTGLSFKF